MRITNSMVTANTKANININKYNSDKQNTMVASGQKITRPSDDPVVAIRALRLNTSISELTQYSDKNIPDADAWFKTTEDALTQADDVLSNIREKLNQAVSEENTTSSVQDILEELKQLKEQYYALGNADSAGRTVFTGYRTSEMLTFTSSEKKEYKITEKLSIDDAELVDYVKGTLDVSKSSGNVAGYEETNIEATKYYRIKLSYGDLSGLVSGTGINYESTSGKTQTQIDDLYAPTSGMNLIAETGELVLSEEAYNALKTGDLEITYKKTDWNNGDLRPEHYFQCEADGIEYNFNRVDDDGNPVKTGGTPTGFIEQEISYEIAYNQSITINTQASDAFSHDIGRGIDELIEVTQKVADSENKISAIETMKEEGTITETQYNTMMKAAQKENTLYKEKMHNLYQTAIGNYKDYSDNLNKQISKIGAMTSRLELTKNRVKDQKSNVKELADDNINVDLTEAALDYQNAVNALEAARLAAGKIADTTLLNYI